MKRILLAGTAILGVAAMTTPAHADLKLDLGGYFRGYAVYEDNDTAAGVTDTSHFDFLKDAEVHFTGETTTDMGLTVGAHFELKMLSNGFPGSGFGVPPKNSGSQGSNNQGSTVDESYAYFSGGWGRVNFGEEDGAAYLLQVAAPSADSNIDGLRPTIQGFQSGFWANSGSRNPFTNNNGNYVLGYDNADFRQTDRLTYLTPKWSGFQAGVSYAPHQGATSIDGNVSGAPFTSNLNDQFKNLWEASARWDGEFSGVGISLGGGYSTSSNETDTAGAANFGSDDLQTWDAGLNLTWQGWSLGGAYKHSNSGVDTNGDIRTWDVGLGWDNGPWHAGASWLNTKFDANAYGGTFTGGDDLKINRYTVGGGYTYGPGMSFRGAVAWMNVDSDGATDDQSPVQVTLGTDINF